MADNIDIQAELRQIEALLRGLEAALSGEALAAAQKPLLEKKARLEGRGVIVQGNDNKVAGPGAILIEGNVYIGPAARDPQEAQRIYRRVLAASTANLPLRGVDVGASDPTAAQKQVKLARVYIDLDTKTQVEVMGRAKEMARRSSPDIVVGEYPLPALDAIAANRRAVLLGDPGSGKSTFVNFLAHCLASHAIEPRAGWLEHLPGWPADEADILPVLVILRDFARRLPKKLPEPAEPHHLWKFITDRLKEQNLEFAAEAITRRLETGKTLLIFDGLDEVPTQSQRRFVRDAVAALARRYPGCRCLVTCRVLSYQPPQNPDEPDLRLEGFPQFELAPFDEDKIERFISAWYAELAHLGTIPTDGAPAMAQHLQQAVRRPDLWELAPNPLLLTVMALVHTHKGALPEARALLYEETVDILLWRWEQLKAGGADGAPGLRGLLQAAGRSNVDLKRALWELAYEAQAQTTAAADEQALADIGELRLQKALAALNRAGSRDWAMQVVEAVKLRAGLLLERAPGIFTFPHRTFQEYLAGAHLASLADFPSQAARLARQSDLWREAVLLAAGKLVYVNVDLHKPLALVGELCPAKINAQDERAWYAAWLAGDVLLEIGLQRACDTNLGCDLLERVRRRLVDLLQQGRLAPVERARAGDTLARLGDPRFCAERWFLPDEPRLGFVEIPAGPFLMGSDPEKDPNAEDDEKPQHDIYLPTFYITRYPVTVAQFQAFVKESGHRPADSNSLAGVSNHPAVRVTWHDALAYCQWLTGRLQEMAVKRCEAAVGSEDQAFWEGLAAGRLRVTLPGEAQWEKAIRGTDGRIYPWGGEFDEDRANVWETMIRRMSTVGCFPAGASPYGVLDMSGNVMEWTRSRDEKYPYQPEDGREELKGKGPRMVRGGAFISHRLARCAYRSWFDPGYWDSNLGFRVVISP